MLDPVNTLDLVLTNPNRLDMVERDPQLGHTARGRGHFAMIWSYITAGSDVVEFERENLNYAHGKYELMSARLQETDWIALFASKTRSYFVTFS
jgi:hypothetical protein